MKKKEVTVVLVDAKQTPLEGIHEFDNDPEDENVYRASVRGYLLRTFARRPTIIQIQFYREKFHLGDPRFFHCHYTPFAVYERRDFEHDIRRAAKEGVEL